MARWRSYFDFRGRAARLDYWRVQLGASVVVGVCMVLTMVAVPAVGPVGGVLMAPVLAALAASLACGVRRLHDRGRSGWWLMVYWPVPAILSAWVEAMGGENEVIVALVSLASVSVTVWSLVELGFLRGTPGPNRYGYDPTQPEPAEAFS